MAGHGPEHGHGAHVDIGEDYNIATLVNTAVIGCLLILLTVLWLRAMFARAERWEWERKVVSAPYSERLAVEDLSKIRISSYDWTDPARNIVSIPLDEAKVRVLHELLVQQTQAGSGRAEPALQITETATADMVAEVAGAHEVATEHTAGAVEADDAQTESGGGH